MVLLGSAKRAKRLCGGQTSFVHHRFILDVLRAYGKATFSTHQPTSEVAVISKSR